MFCAGSTFFDQVGEARKPVTLYIRHIHCSSLSPRYKKFYQFKLCLKINCDIQNLRSLSQAIQLRCGPRYMFSINISMENPIHFAQRYECHHQGTTPTAPAKLVSRWLVWGLLTSFQVNPTWRINNKRTVHILVVNYVSVSGFACWVWGNWVVCSCIFWSKWNVHRSVLSIARV